MMMPIHLLIIGAGTASPPAPLWPYEIVALVLLAAAASAIIMGWLWRSRAKLLADLRAELADRARAEQALRESEVFYHTLVETLPQNIFRKDLEGRFTFGNRRFCASLGCPLEEIVGKTDFDFFPRELSEKYRHDDQRVVKTGRPLDVIEQYVSPHGKTLHVQVIKTPLRDADGRSIGIQGLFWDVSDRLRAEERLQEQNRLLQEMARSEREAHEALTLAQRQLVQSEKLISLGQMVAGVAHEINNPLAFVTNNVAVLERDLREVSQILRLYVQADAAVATACPEIAASIVRLRDDLELDYVLENLPGLLTRTRDGLKRIQQIVLDLRVFARLDESEMTDIDLIPGIESTINIILGYAKKKDVRIKKELAALPPLRCIAAKINQVVMNLLSNAIDASPPGGEVIVRTRTRDGDGGICVEVQDQGGGIDPTIREKIFDPFFTTKPVGQGTGLGLAISFGIVQDHGGTIEVTSEPGRGAAFTVTLPLRPPGS